MKRFFKTTILSIAILSLGSVISCKKYLDKAPQADVSPAQAFKNFANFQGFTEELYNCIPLMTAHSYHNSWNLGEDEFWETGVTYPLAYRIDQGDFWAWNGAGGTSWFYAGGNPSSQARGDKGNLWGLSWYGIRKANIGLANLDLLIEATEEEKKLIAGQLYFFRGWFHFMLMQYWGGLPYIDTALPTDQPITLPRLSYQQCADKAAEDFQRAADLLPINWDETTAGLETKGNNNLRINKIMALAYMGKNLLWAGSPLMNKVSTGDASYQVDYCKKAADAFAKALQLTESTKRYQLADFSQYSRIFYTYNQNGKVPGLNEAIFMENLVEFSSRWRWNQVNDYRPMTINPSGVKVNPPANYVNYYGMANGLPILNPEKADAASGYDPEYPWRNRDPRLYHDIIIDGEKCVNNGGFVGNNEYRQYASLYSGGLYRTDNNTKAILTGYMNSKFTSKFMNNWEGFADNNTLVLSFMRLSDIYLMYAESVAAGYSAAEASVSGYTLSAADAVNKVRDRAGVGHVNSLYLGSAAAFLQEVRRERAVELAFEGHRFVDLRRWLLLTERPYTLKTAIEFDRATPNAQIYANPRAARVKNFRETVLIERNLGQKHYWFPFLQSDVNMYDGFQQNPGW